MKISSNSLVKMNYKGTLDDGSVFDTSEGKEPLEFIFGIGMIISGLEKGIEGLDVGEKKTVKVSAIEAYGPVMEQAVQEVPKDQFPADIKLEVGMQLAAQGPQGVIPVSVKEIKDDSVIVDFNHPLAGKDLTFEVEIVEVCDATEEDQTRILGPMMPHDHEGGCMGGCASCHDSSCSGSLEDSLDEEESEEDSEEEKKKE